MDIRGVLKVPNFMRYGITVIYKAEIGPTQTLIWHQNLSKVCLTTSYQIPVIGSLRLCSRYPNQNVMEFVKSSALTHYVKFIRVVIFCLFWKQSILTNFFVTLISLVDCWTYTFSPSTNDSYLHNVNFHQCLIDSKNPLFSRLCWSFFWSYAILASNSFYIIPMISNLSEIDFLCIEISSATVGLFVHGFQINNNFFDLINCRLQHIHLDWSLSASSFGCDFAS